MAARKFTPAQIKSAVRYIPETGTFVRLIGASRSPVGSETHGTKTKRGNLQISILGSQIKSHIAAWVCMTGTWPENEIDHRDGDPTNNRWGNLREATGAQNKQNQRRPRSDNACGFLGVHKHATRKDGSPVWRARIQIDGKSVHVGLFNDPTAAHAAYVEAKRRLHPFGTL